MKIPVIATAFVLLSFSLHAADHAVILLYHHVSDETPASTSVSPAIFRQHLDYLESNDFRVMPLSQVLKTLEEGRPVPDRAVAITFDDAYRSVYDQAMPLLKEKEYPFTVFVNTEAIDNQYRNYMSWNDLKALMDVGAEIGNHSHTHPHLVRILEGETTEQWGNRVEREIVLAAQRLQKKLGVEVAMFAYPYGEHTPELRKIIGELGYMGIAQQSGAVGYGFNRLAVPRFPMATNYADMDRFAVSVNSRPLPVTGVSSGPSVQVEGESGRHRLVFALLPGGYRSSGLSCYSSDGERLVPVREDGRISVQLPDWKAGRRKINCTAPSSSENGEYYWYSHLWLVKKPDGQWYTE
ncbi:MAG TPA: polysaccharide deacetylase [Desulfobacteraceae bacterium]|nr:polysaccharide deacetylase [Desulfobacteraceae bacterium]